jgi:hypothetical protein
VSPDQIDAEVMDSLTINTGSISTHDHGRMSGQMQRL